MCPFESISESLEISKIYSRGYETDLKYTPVPFLLRYSAINCLYLHFKYKKKYDTTKAESCRNQCEVNNPWVFINRDPPMRFLIIPVLLEHSLVYLIIVFLPLHYYKPVTCSYQRITGTETYQKYSPFIFSNGSPFYRRSLACVCVCACEREEEKDDSEVTLRLK